MTKIEDYIIALIGRFIGRPNKTYKPIMDSNFTKNTSLWYNFKQSKCLYILENKKKEQIP